MQSTSNAELLLKVVDENDIPTALNLIREEENFKHAIYHLQFRINKPTDLPYFQSTYPPQWIGRYIQNQYSEIDPVVLDGFGRTEPFLWKELEATTPEQRAFFKDSIENGIGSSGFSVPVNDKSNRQALFSVTSDLIEEDWEKKINSIKETLIQIGDVLHRKVVASQQKQDNEISLAPREIECLNWTAKGKDSPTVATILGLSEYTVRDYIKSARHKLGCNTVAQAVYEATKRRMIDF